MFVNAERLCGMEDTLNSRRATSHLVRLVECVVTTIAQTFVISGNQLVYTLSKKDAANEESYSTAVWTQNAVVGMYCRHSQRWEFMHALTSNSKKTLCHDEEWHSSGPLPNARAQPYSLHY
ncbi:hypothetical protein TNCV_1867291 [Trichonephila clavipes]|nr:hypothetical protein TNCV_1867291 [Trichonephila clavipes]